MILLEKFLIVVTQVRQIYDVSAWISRSDSAIKLSRQCARINWRGSCDLTEAKQS